MSTRGILLCVVGGAALICFGCGLLTSKRVALQDGRAPRDPETGILVGAEPRNLRSTVPARKVSFGSQSDAGAKTRSRLMTVMHTLKKRGFHPASQLKLVLDQLANDISLEPFPLLFSRDCPCH